VAGKASSCFEALLVGARPKTKGVLFSVRIVAGTIHDAGVKTRAYFLALVVFLAGFFLAAFFFVAMALVPPFLCTQSKEPEKCSQCFFSVAFSFFARGRFGAEVGKSRAARRAGAAMRVFARGAMNLAATRRKMRRTSIDWKRA
jgi:hypothetical protein